MPSHLFFIIYRTQSVQLQIDDIFSYFPSKQALTFLANYLQTKCQNLLSGKIRKIDFVT